MQQQIDEVVGRARPVDIAGLELHVLAASDHLCTARQHIPLHRHPWYSLIVTTCGASRHLFPECETTIRANDLLFIPPGVLHSWTSLQVPLQMRGFIFEIHGDQGRLEHLRSVLVDAVRHGLYHYALPDTDLVEISNKLFESASTTSPLFVETVLSLMRLFLVVGLKNSVGSVLESSRGAPQTPERSHAERVVHRARSHILANLDQPLLRDDVAHHVHFSLRHLDRMFHDRTGTSLGSFIRRAKLERAMTLLAKSELSVKEVAYAVGYREEASFYRMIHRELRMSPGQFRNSRVAHSIDNGSADK